MTSKERLLVAMCNGQPDRVPACPDISNMIPSRLTGKPFWDLYLYKEPPLWKAYIEAVKYFGIDGWFTYGRVKFNMNRVTIESKAGKARDGRVSEEYIYHTPFGEMRGEMTYYMADSPTWTEKPIKNILRDFDRLRCLYSGNFERDDVELEAMRAELGERGIFGLTVGYPGLQNWFTLVQGGIEDLSYTYYDHPELIEEWRVMEDRYCVKAMEMALDASPDFILFGGSGSITLQSPELFRELCLPTIKTLTRMAKEAGIPTMLHSCGKERALVEMCAMETDLNCVNPLEIPPMGDCDLGEIKRSFGSKIAIMGNLHTTELMLKGTPQEVEDAAIRCIEAAGAGGGFILSTGDQCGRDTPDENIFKMVEVCQRYGIY